MLSFMDRQIISLKNKCGCFLADLKEERGDSNFVSILLIILIAVAVAFIFKDQLMKLVNNVFDAIKIDDLTKH